MTKIKKVKVLPEAPVDVVDEVNEPEVVVEPTLSEAKKELKRIYAASKTPNPKQYAFKNKDAQLAVKLAKL